MALIQFTRNHTDHSTDRGYQFEFFCDRCGNGYLTTFQTSAVNMAGSALRTLGGLFGGFMGTVGSSAYEIERAIQGPGHDKAFTEAVDETKPKFHLCNRCAKWVCLASCWNDRRQLCYTCAPDVEAELAAAQVQTTVDQIHQKLQSQDLTANIDLTSEATAQCPACGARSQGSKFCPDCGKPLAATWDCSQCHTKVASSAKFCPECGKGR